MVRSLKRTTHGAARRKILNPSRIDARKFKRSIRKLTRKIDIQTLEGIKKQDLPRNKKGLVRKRFHKKYMRRLKKPPEAVEEVRESCPLSESVDPKKLEKVESKVPQPIPFESWKEEPGEENVLSIVIINPNVQRPVYLSPRVKIIREFVAEVPEYCTEARSADKDGLFVSKREFPGIPKRKFNQQNKEQLEDKERDWPVQAIYDDGCESGWLRVYYEGWTCYYLHHERVDELVNATDILNTSRIRRAFIEARKKWAAKEVDRTLGAEVNPIDRQAAIDNLFVEPNVTEHTNPFNSFWWFEDLTYFHSVVNKDFGLAPVFYMACVNTKSPIRPPCYSYTAINIVDLNVYENVIQRRFNRPFDELMYPKDCVWKSKSVCTGKSCVCDKRFTLLYRDVNRYTQQLKYREDGRVDFTNFDIDMMRIIVECSDACGCDSTCPRRQLQRGQSIPMVVYYERGKGYGLRAAGDIKAGQLVCEYTGHVILIDGYESDKEEAEEEEPKEEVVCPAKPPEKKRKRIRTNFTNSRRVVTAHKEKEVSADSTHDFSKESSSEEVKKDTSYEAGMSVMCRNIAICALTKGNIARFINHSCNSNTVFVEVHSRKFESDPLIPRIGVYATKDIALGEEITVSYWTATERLNSKSSGVACKCGEQNCCKVLPGSM